MSGVKLLRVRWWRGVFLAWCACVGLSAVELREGVDYVVLNNPIPNAENSVIEVYSYACPFCYKYAKILPQILDKLPSDVDFRPYHLEQKGDYGRLASEIFAVLLVKDRRDGVGALEEKSLFHRVQGAYFEEYHVKKNRWSDGGDAQGFLETGLKTAGISESEFQAALEDREVQELLKSWAEGYDIAMVQGIPAFVVNGKYLIKISELKSLDDLGEKMGYLLKQ